MDHNDEKRRVAFDEKPPQANPTGGPLVGKDAYEGSITSIDDTGDRWRDGWDDRRERRILRKMDIHLLPFVSLLYLLSFL